MAPAAGDDTALLVLSTVGWFSPLPWLGSAVGSVAPPACHIALAAARVQSGVQRGGAQNDSKLATSVDEPGVVGPVGPWHRYDAPAYAADNFFSPGRRSDPPPPAMDVLSALSEPPQATGRNGQKDA